MVQRRRLDDIEYYEYTPMTMEYNPDVNAFTIARADIHSRSSQVRLVLIVIVTEADVTRERLSGHEVITRGRDVLECLIAQHRGLADSLEQTMMFVFNFRGQRIV
jgi:hypothetical protein